MTKICDTYLHKDKVCCICGEVTEDYLRYSTEGYVSSCTTVLVCNEHLVYKKIGDTVFVKAPDTGELMYSVNADYGDFSVVRPVVSVRHFEQLKIKNELDFIQDINLFDGHHYD